MCSGKVNAGHQVLKYALDFVNTYKEDKFFGFFWIMNFGHDAWQSPKSIDLVLTDFFKRIAKTGVLKKTFVILFSDHGMRFGTVRYQSDAFFEERLPMLFMHVPDHFKKTQPLSYANLVMNQKRLISPFDLHLTMKQVLNVRERFRGTDDCKSCISSLENIPETRRCVDAGINDVWCACHDMLKTCVKTDRSALTAVVKSFSYLQNVTQNLAVKQCTACQVLYMDKLVRVHSYILNNIQYYIAAYLMKSGLMFEVIIKKIFIDELYNYETIWYDTISPYSSKGKCVINANFRRYCVCERRKKCLVRIVYRKNVKQTPPLIW